MRKKILIGSIFVLTLLLLMPSIPAIQQKTIEDRVYNNLVEPLDAKNIRIIKVFEQIKHPILFFIVGLIISFRGSRAWYLYEISTEWPDESRWLVPDIQYPLLYLRFLMLIITTSIWVDFWYFISNILDWNWCF